ncbi:DUF3139 domain-containing protein [Sporosarcina koreensis]|uniref:DUF3139 domain-containing protein n=1 Tax=Bacillales TaxID=1385 RepID=UPI0007522353|nr:DUF3139 domain-containing protein [Sporosarcina koreensis]
MRFTILLTIITLLLFSAFGINRVHIQKHFAEKAFEKYIAEQGISVSNIERKEMKWDDRRKSYTVMVHYKEDPGLRYDYRHNKFMKRSIKLVVSQSDEFNDEPVTPIEKGMKYPPLD